MDMNNFSNDKFFFLNDNWSKEFCQKTLDQNLKGFDDGELYIQEVSSESIVFDDQKLSNANYNISRGFGLRGVIGEVASYAHTSDLSEKSLLKAFEVVNSIKKYEKPINKPLEIISKPHQLYLPLNPFEEVEFAAKVDLVKTIDEYIRSKSNLVRQVTIAIGGSSSRVTILKQEGKELSDLRPMVQFSISVTLMKDGKLEMASETLSARKSLQEILGETTWQNMANKAIETAMIKLEAEHTPAGEYRVVLGNGDPGILLHEAVGHGLEGDFNRKKTSAFSDLIGKQVAAKGVTVIDDGTIAFKRGSLNFDDEGTPTKRNVLIEDGILVGYLQDRMNARLMDMEPTGNGRRESYAHQPMPRMTNTFMLGGMAKEEEIIASVDNGIYFPKFTSGQVDITSGKFVFESGLAYMIENGKITRPLKGATLIGNGPDVMKKIIAIADNFVIDDHGGNCGKAGQTVPVGIGQPSLLIDKITVGGNKI
jgi:TldD protein